MSDFLELGKVVGIPLAMAIIALGAFYSGRIYSRAAWEDLKQAHREAIAERDEQIQKLERRERELFEIALMGTRAIETATTALKDQRQRRS